jgi:hypothetical protein
MKFEIQFLLKYFKIWLFVFVKFFCLLKFVLNLKPNSQKFKFYFTKEF